MEKLENSKSHIPGWGSDADKTKRPAYIMWQRPEGGTGAHWEEPEQQPNFSDFHSIERHRHTHVFGDTVQPSGVSGIIRKIAFRYGEGSFAHWMLLIFADRVNMFEGIADDLSKGIWPGLLRERGWNVDKKFKTKRYKKVRNLTVVAAVSAAGIAAYLLNNKSEDQISGS